jgi:hypothetical protein
VPLEGKARRLAQANFGTQMKGATDKDRKMIWGLYSELSHRDPEKDTILAKWNAEKSCKWANSYSQSRTVKTSTKQKTSVGHGTKFDVAKLMNMVPYHEHRDLVDQICSELPEEGEWDDGIPIEAAYKKAKLKRFALELKEMGCKTTTDETKETLESTKYKDAFQFAMCFLFSFSCTHCFNILSSLLCCCILG